MKRPCLTLIILGIIQMVCKSPIQAPSLIDLCGAWQFRFDLNSLGEPEGWYKPKNEGEWLTIKVPGSYNAAFPDSAWYQGKGWYRTEFEIPAEWVGGRVMLRFLGVAIRTKVWLNGKFIGGHLFPYTGFHFDVTDKLNKTGINHLVVMADNEILDQAIPDKKWNGWWNFGGVNRQVLLEHLPDVTIDDVTVTTTMSGKGNWRLRISVQVKNNSSSVCGRLKLAVLDNNGKKKWQSKQRGEFPSGKKQFEFTEVLGGIEAWTPNTPNLYLLRLRSEGEDRSVHSKQVRFGFRQIETRGTQIFLNGEPLRVQGISRHELWPSTGMTVSEVRTRLDLQDIKSLGCNMVRLAHYSQHPRVYDICDELGLLVWSEIPAWQSSVKVLADSQVFATYVKPQLQEMITEHRNHPSALATVIRLCATM